MNSELDAILEECLAEIESGQATIADCLARYPDYAADLKKTLTLAANLQQLRTPGPSESFRVNTGAALREFMRAHPRTPTAAQTTRLWRLPRWQASIAALAACMFLLFILYNVSDAALPGDSLYTVKIAGEQVWRSFQSDTLAADLTLSARRADEVIRAKDNPRVENLALQNYDALLEVLKKYSDPDAQQRIQSHLQKQHDILNNAGVKVKDLDQFIRSVTTPAPTLEPGQPLITPARVEPTTLPIEFSTPTVPASHPTPVPAIPTVPRPFATEPNPHNEATPEATSDHDHPTPPRGKPTDPSLPPGHETHGPPTFAVPGLSSPTPTLPHA